ncbi:protein TolB [Klebsiella pneumoniae]|nr:protein TolB [Klebsiella pneumoniae]
MTWEGSQNQDADVSADGKTMVMVSSAGGQQHIAKQDLETGGVQVLSSTFLDETPSNILGNQLGFSLTYL